MKVLVLVFLAAISDVMTDFVPHLGIDAVVKNRLDRLKYLELMSPEDGNVQF